jgi:Flp pilus assembly protein TadG
MIHSSGRTSRRRGVAAVEFAALLPGILTLLVGIWEVGRMAEIQQIMSNAAREGGRQAASGQLTNSQVKTVVKQYLQVAGLPTTNVTVTVTNLTSNGVDASQANYQDQIQITVTMPFSDVSWSVLSYATPATYQLSAQVQWMSVLDRPYPTGAEPPVG